MDIYFWEALKIFFSGYVRKVETGTWKVEDTVLSCKNETAIITGMGLNTPPHQKSLVKNLQNIIRDVFQTPTNQLMTAKPSPKLYNCSFKVDGYTLLSMTFLGPLWWQCQLTLLSFVLLQHTTHLHLLPTLKDGE